LTFDSEGSLWIGLNSGDLARLRNGHLDTFHFEAPGFEAPAGSYVYQLSISPDGAVFGSTLSGLVIWKDGMQRVLAQADGLRCADVLSFAWDSQGGLWLYTGCGLQHIVADSLQAWWSNRDHRVSVRIFDWLDGAYPALVPFRGAARSPDGRLWFINQRMVQSVDPEHISENHLVPAVRVETVLADLRSYPVRDGLQLPPLTRDIELDFTALSFAAPTKMQFRYMMQGHDATWQNPGLRRQAFYTDLPPGSYQFRVVASNNDGVWNRDGASLRFSVAPAWYQIDWVRILALVCVGLLLLALYRWRMRNLSSALAARFDERLVERTRLAGEIHDTLLQTIQGSKMVADDALVGARSPADMRQAIERMSQWLSVAVDEGRRALQALRTSAVEKNDLAPALQRAAEECRLRTPIRVAFGVKGVAREMHPVVRDEIYRVGYEAIRNACTHSRGSLLEVELDYSQDLRLRVKDDGMGIDPDIATRGKPGHFGLQGMRERARRINAKLTVSTYPGPGTEIMLIVPARIIFVKSRALPLE
jgi:signal transduction histidine kinase